MSKGVGSRKNTASVLRGLSCRLQKIQNKTGKHFMNLLSSWLWTEISKVETQLCLLWCFQLTSANQYYSYLQYLPLRFPSAQPSFLRNYFSIRQILHLMNYVHCQGSVLTGKDLWPKSARSEERLSRSWCWSDVHTVCYFFALPYFIFHRYNLSLTVNQVTMCRNCKFLKCRY